MLHQITSSLLFYTSSRYHLCLQWRSNIQTYHVSDHAASKENFDKIKLIVSLPAILHAVSH